MKHPELSYGSRGGTVRALQQLVSQAEHAKPGLSRDGIFGPLTKAAVTRFQRMHHLQQDGVVGSETWAALGASLRLPQLAASAPKAVAHPVQPLSPISSAPRVAVHPAGMAAAPSHPVQSPPALRHQPLLVPPHTVVTRADQAGPVDEPRWFQVALAEFQAHHTIFGTVDGNQRIHEYFLTTTYHPKVGSREAWCSAFANWCMLQAGIRGTRDAAAASWLDWGVELSEPRHGCIMVIHWAGKHVGSGNHVTFFDHAAGDRIFYFGGNQTKQHQISLGNSSRRGMASIHYRWPRA